MHAVGKWIVCKVVKKEKQGSLFLPTDSFTGSYNRVEAIGSDVTIKIEEGDKVLFRGKNAIGHEDLVIVHEDDVLIIL